MFAQSNFDEAKYLTLGVGAVNVAFTIVAVSIHYMMFSQVSVQRMYVCMYLCIYVLLACTVICWPTIS